MKKIKEKWDKFTKAQKILAIILGILIISIITVSCSNSDKLEEGSSNTKQEQQKEEPIVEPKEEPESNDISNNDEELKDDIESVDYLALSILREDFDNNSYDISVNTTYNTVNVEILSYDIDVSQLSESQREYVLYSSDIPSSFDNLADIMKEFYIKAGYDVNVKIRLYDINDILIYTAKA